MSPNSIVTARTRQLLREIEDYYAFEWSRHRIFLFGIFIPFDSSGANELRSVADYRSISNRGQANPRSRRSGSAALDRDRRSGLAVTSNRRW